MKKQIWTMSMALVILVIAFILPLTAAAVNIAAYEQDFESYEAGDFQSGTDGFTFEHNTAGTSYVKIVEDASNKYLSVGKTAADNGYTLSKDYKNTIAPFSDYIIEFKLKLMTNTNGSSFNFYDGVYFSVGYNAGAKESKLQYHNGKEWLYIDQTFDLSDWKTFKIYIHANEKKGDLYIEDTLVIEKVPVRYSNSSFGSFSIGVNNAVVGSWNMDDFSITGIASCFNENYELDDVIDFEDFSAGNLKSGTGGVIYTDNPNIASYVKVEYDGANDNKYLAVGKSGTDNVFMVQRFYNDIIRNYDHYIVDFKFKITGTGSYNISESMALANNGLSININANGDISYVSDGDSTSSYLSQKANLNTWYRVKYVIHKQSKTADLYFEETLIAKNIPSRKGTEYGALVLTANKSAKGSVCIDDIVIKAYGFYTGTNWVKDSIIDFEDFTKGYLISGDGGLVFTQDSRAGAFAKIEAEEENNNQYLTIEKEKVGISFNFKREYSSLTNSWGDYTVDLKFKLQGVGTYNISESAGFYNRGLLINIAHDGCVKYYSGTEAEGASSDGYIILADKIDVNDWVHMRFVVHTATKTGDIYINDKLIAKDAPSRDGVAFGGICITANNSVSGSLSVDDIIIEELADYIYSDQLLIDLRTIHGYKGLTTDVVLNAITVADGITVRILDGDKEAEGLITKGMILEASHESGNTQKYIFGEEASVIDDIYYTFNGFATEGKFGIGEIAAYCSFKNYQPFTKLTLIIAQYENDRLIKVSHENGVYTKDGMIKVILNTEKAEATTVKIMLFDSLENLTPLKNAILLEPYLDDENVLYVEGQFFPGFVTKAVTFSYDDGIVDSDRELIARFNERNIPATFNINYKRYEGYSEGQLAEIVALYEGHEVANHTYNHDRMYITDPSDSNYVDTESCIVSIVDGRKALEDLFGYEILGFAWPFTRAEREDILNYLYNSGVAYMRNSDRSYSYEIPEDWMNWSFTSRDNTVFTYWDDFIKEDMTNSLKLFSVWGHSYEFTNDDYPISFDYFEPFLDEIVQRDDLYVDTNINIVSYINALRALEITGQSVINNSDFDVYLRINGENVIIKAKSSYCL